VIAASGSADEPSAIVARRRVARHANAFVLDLIKAGGYRGNVLDAVIRAAVGQANLGHLLRDPEANRRYASLEDDPPDEVRRPVSISALAVSLGAPFETVRRRMIGLCADGYCRQVPGGVILPRSATSSPATGMALIYQWERLHALYDRLRAVGLFADLVEAAAPGAMDPPPVRLAGRYVTDFVLRQTDPATWLVKGSVGSVILMEVVHANTEQLDDASGTEEGGRTPDSLRRPVSARAVSARLAIPYETVRRHLLSLEARGYCRRQAGGYVAAAQPLDANWVGAMVDHTFTQVTRLFAGLAEHGVVAAWEAERRAVTG
jgi:hypothetical protein